MKSKILKFLQKILRSMAHLMISKYKPTVVGITGSVGKTSTKEAVALVLSSKYRVRKNEKNYNNEIGLPLTVIGVETGGKSPFRWALIFLKWLSFMLLPRKYPEILVLEMGVDRPGDMDYLTGFIPVTVGILTVIGNSHLEFFRGIEHIAREKGKILKNVPEHGLAVLNADDERIMGMREKIKVPVLTYGLSKMAHVMADHHPEGGQGGINFKLNYDGKSVPIRMPHVLAEHMVPAALAAIAAGIYFKINLVEIAEMLEKFSPPPGRMNLIGGIKNTLILDDTYNASPKSTIAALETLEKIHGGRKIAVLGDMLELGEDSNSGHREVADKVFSARVDLFFAIGSQMEAAVKRLKELGYPSEKVFYFSDLNLLGRKVQEELREGDVILAKGSQGMRLEKVVEEIMADPLKAEKLLCRQSREWKKKPINAGNF